MKVDPLRIVKVVIHPDDIGYYSGDAGDRFTLGLASGSDISPGIILERNDNEFRVLLDRPVDMSGWKMATCSN